MKNNEEYSVFSKRLKERRNKLGYTQEAFAKRTEGKEMELKKSRIGKYETLKDGDNGFPLLSTGIFLAKELDCSLDWLCGLSDIDTFNAEHPDSDIESVEVILFRIIASILDEEITDWSIEDLIEDKTAILLKNDVFEEFIVEYRDAIDFEESTIEKFGNNSSFANKATELKEEILMKYVRKYIDSKNK